ncbi:MAG: hypothetical protein QNJ63_24170 [Calothrix sp. MO_192.B10]|nr:hypothetical protein [Calothrix sp. MO_192.B10]
MIRSLIPFGKLIEAIAGVASPIVKDKFQRNETVIKVLTQVAGYLITRNLG